MNTTQKSLSQYGIIGNCRSVLLVSEEASIDFGCLPDFDSPSQFLKILDEKKGGFFKILPKGFYLTSQKYIENTNILETTFFNADGTVAIEDLMPILKLEEEANKIPEFGTKILRLIRALKGNHNFELTLKLTPNYARDNPIIKEMGNTIEITDSKYKYILYKKQHKTKIQGDIITVIFSLNEGGQEFFALDLQEKNTEPKVVTDDHMNKVSARLYYKTKDFWRWWVSLCSYTGPFSKQVIRSALTLKLLTFNPTGAIVASPTTSLPEKLGGKLNWDYRYTWLRDSAFTIYAFLGLGYLKEAEEFMNFLEMACTSGNSDLKVMYTIRGESLLEEQTLAHLSGYKNSKPVRIGNGASNQKQFDIFGEVLVAISLYLNAGGKLSDGMKDFVVRLIDYCSKHWQEKDTGIWEGRDGEKHNTYSKLMCWVGMDRGIRLAQKLKLKVDLDSWTHTREEIKKDILTHGFNKNTGSFTAYYDSSVLDTSTLNIPIVGFLKASDLRVKSTIENIMKNLTHDWFVLRTSDEENELQQGEGTFFLSTFWLIDNLALLGKTKEAKIWMEKIVSMATPLGLYAEEFDPKTKEHLGNFPQAFTHLGLINSALNLKQAVSFGFEGEATTQTERLSKVIKSIYLTGKATLNIPQKTLQTALDIFLPYELKALLDPDTKRKTRRNY